MADFESPIGNKKIHSRPLRELDVPDESMEKYKSIDPVALSKFQNSMNFETSDAEELEIRRAIEARKEAKEGKTRLTDGARQRIERLIGMIRGTHTVEIEKTEYSFQTLKTKEMRAAMQAASEFNGTVQFPYELRKQLLARSLIKIAGIEISAFLNSDSLDIKLAFIDELDDVLLFRLYDEYLKMVKEIRARYDMATENDAKEVAEDLKK